MQMLTYDEAVSAGRERVGTKAFSVARCRAAGFCVPDGVVLPVPDAADFHAGSPADEAYAKIRDYFAEDCTLIVRSSGVQEDSADASFAGQYLSVVCRNNVADIRSACEACQQSGGCAQVRAYRDAVQGAPATGPGSMGILIQRLVPAEAAGVCFTRDPQGRGSGAYTINAVRGLGETLAAGETIADHYVVGLADNSVQRRVVGQQHLWRTAADPWGLTRLPEDLFGTAVLSDNQCLAIARMGARAEAFFSAPQDIEWAWAGDTLLLLQSRPVTTTGTSGCRQVWTRDNVAEVIPDAVTPFTWSFVEGPTNRAFQGALRAAGLPVGHGRLFDLFDGHAYFNRSQYQGIFQHSSVFGLVRIAACYSWLLLRQRSRVRSFEARFASALQQGGAGQGATRIRALHALFEDCMHEHMRVAVMFEIGLTILRRMIGRYISARQIDSVLDNVWTGLNEVASTAPGEALAKLAGLIRKNASLRRSLLNVPDEEARERVMAAGDPYAGLLKRFFDTFGYASLKEFEIYFPRWDEDPGFVMAALKNLVAGAGPGDVRAECERRAEKQRFARADLFRRTPLVWQVPVRWYVRHIGRCSIWRESLKQQLVQIMAAVRAHLIEMARTHNVDPPEDMAFLEIDDVCRLDGRGGAARLPEKIAAISDRKRLWQHYRLQKPFQEIRVLRDGRRMNIPHRVRTGPMLSGLALSGGYRAGVARVVHDPARISRFDAGDILVASSTNPAWTPLFTLAGAIVTDMGNYLSHGAIVARELGIPAVGNLRDATQRIIDGQQIEVDGDSGVVYLGRGASSSRSPR